MKGIVFSIEEGSDKLQIEADPLLCEENLTLADVSASLHDTEYADMRLFQEVIATLNDEIKAAKADGNMDAIVRIVGAPKETGVTVEVDVDLMSASITVTLPEDQILPSFSEVVALLSKHKIKRGISKKRIQNLLNTALENEPGKKYTEVVAKGLPPRAGRPSRLVPLVPNALDRVLRPQELGDNKVDMRNLGDILCVETDQAVAQRIAPTNGREGYTVTNKTLAPMKGEWEAVKLGDNTRISEHDENIILATLSGQPKFNNDVMSVDDTFVAKGVNVGTGNVDYKGAVIVNGDVTENMQIIATGDVTINGFVESAFIKSGGDIIITQGATGKMNDEDCRLISDGSMFLQHGQGLDLKIGKDLTVKRQLAYSRVQCKGDIVLGDEDNPNGNIFASKITCYGSVKAGSVGAVSGSALEFDYSEGYNQISEHLGVVSDFLDSLVSVNADHEVRLSKINQKRIPESLKRKLAQLDSTIDRERNLLNYLRKLQGDLGLAKTQYENNARIVAHKEMYPGVVVKLNKRIYKANKETLKTRIVFVNGDWEYQPIIERK
jgi:uncharacterized protein (DUF342 family)